MRGHCPQGFLLVKLTAAKHHAEYIDVSNTCTPDYTAKCSVAFDW